MGVCVRCGKRSSIIDKHGHCEKCHNELFVQRMKRMAGDTSEETGILYKRFGLLNKPVCRLCGNVIPFGAVKTDIDARTGYCSSCTARLKEKYRALNGDEEAQRRIREREEAAALIIQAMEEGCVEEVLRAGLDDPGEEDPEDAFDYEAEDEDDGKEI